MAGTLISGGQPSQLVIDQRQLLIRRMWITLLNLGQGLREIGHGPIVAARFRPITSRRRQEQDQRNVRIASY